MAEQSPSILRGKDFNTKLYTRGLVLHLVLFERTLNHFIKLIILLIKLYSFVLI
jgi:hypothetical protein